MTVFIRLRALFRKELIQLFKNPKTRLTLFLPAVLQLLVLGYAATMDLKDVDFAVLDHSRTQESRALTAKFSGNTAFSRKADLQSEEEMADRISRRDIKMALVIPRQFTRALRGKMKPAVQVIVDGRNCNTAGLILGYAASVMDLYNKELSGASPVTIQSRAWFNPNYSAQYFMVPALLATIALLNLMLLTALAMAKEQEEGTFDQLLLTPYSATELLVVKGASSIFVGFCQLTVGLLLALYWFRIPFMGNFALLYLLFFSFMFASVGIGLLISVLSRDLNQAMMGTFLIGIPFAALSGLATPIESMPEFLQTITLANPIRHGIKSLQWIFLEGVQFTELLPIFGFLYATGIITFLIADYLFMRQRKC